MVKTRSFMIVGVMLVLTGLFNVLDYYFTLKALSIGYEEANPVVDIILDTPLFPIIKLVVIPAMLFIIWLLRDKVEKRLAWYVGTVFVAYSALMLHFCRILIFSLG